MVRFFVSCSLGNSLRPGRGLTWGSAGFAYWDKKADAYYSPLFHAIGRFSRAAYLLKPIVLGGVLLLTATKGRA